MAKLAATRVAELWCDVMSALAKRPPARRVNTLLVVLALLWPASWPADAAPPSDGATDAWKTTGEAYRRLLLLALQPQSLQRELVSSVVFVQERSSSPEVRIRYRGGVRQVVVTTAWLGTTRDLMSAAAATTAAKAPACFAAYLQQQAEVLSIPEGGFSTWSRRAAPAPFEDFLESPGNPACRDVTRRVRHGPAVAAAAQVGVDAAMNLAIGRALESLAFIAPTESGSGAAEVAAWSSCESLANERRVIATMGKLRINTSPLAPLYVLEARTGGSTPAGCPKGRQRAEAYLGLLPGSAYQDANAWLEAIRWPP